MATSSTTRVASSLSTEAALVKPASHHYRPDIDGLRAFSVLAVVGVHTGSLSGGFIGVDVFFVISGFLISGIIWRDLERGRFSIRQFYARRIKRIFPSLALVLLFTVAIGWVILLPDAYQRLGKEVWQGAAFVLNLGLDWHFASNHFPDPSTLAVSHLWSLGVEEQFYLLWPILLLITWKSPRRQLAIIIALMALSFAINIAVSSRWSWAAYGLPWTRLWELAAGGVLAQLSSDSPAGRGPPRAVVSGRWPKWIHDGRAHLQGILGIALLITACICFQHPERFPGYAALMPVGGAVLVISAGMDSIVNRYVLSASPMVSIGLVSYPLYLWHFPLLQSARIVGGPLSPAAVLCVVALSLILSFLSYRYVELPIRSSAHSGTKLVALCVAMGACVMWGVLMSVRVVPGRSVPPDAQRVFVATTEDWLVNTRNRSWTMNPDGLLFLGGGPERVLFIGDGNMQQYYPRIAAVLERNRLNRHSAVFAVREGCAPGVVEITDTDAADKKGCRDLIARAMDSAKDPLVHTVVIAACWPYYFLENGDLTPDSGRAFDGLSRTIATLVAEEKRVYLVLSTPVGVGFDPRQMIRRTLVDPGFRPLIEAPARAGVMKAVGSVDSRLVQIARITGARVIDPKVTLCNESACPAVTESDEPMYHDSLHLRPSFARSSATFMDQTILDQFGDASQESSHR